MNVLVTGANGQLGNELRLAAAGSAHRYIFTDVSCVPGQQTVSLDITDEAAVQRFCRAEDVGCIINCAAYTNVDRAEEDEFLADRLNHVAVSYLAQAAKENDAALIHISTDYVFDGKSCVPYREDDEKSPLGVYGATKLAGEKAVQDAGCRYIIFRTAWLYSPFGKNFVRTMQKLTAEKEEISVVFDQAGTPTYAADLAALICGLVEDGAMLDRTGIYHFSDEGVTSWYDFAKVITELSGNECRINPVHSEEYPSRAARPHYSVLDKTKVKETFGVEIPFWMDSLKDCIERLK